MKLKALLPAMLLLAAVSGCSAGGASLASTESAAAPYTDLLTSDSAEVRGQDAADADSQIITTGYLTITAEDPIAAASEAIRIAEQAGGRVDARTENGPAGRNSGSATVTLRLPSATLTETLDDIKALGEVEEVSLSSVDVTAETRDLDARITATRASFERLLALLVSASDTETLIALETAIAERQSSLESMEAQRRHLADQVSLSTVQLRLISQADAPVEEPDTFWTGLVAGWEAFVAFFAGVLVVLGMLLPWLALAAVIAALVLLLLRRRRTKTAPADPSSAP